MGDTLLNGRAATDFELAAVAHGRRCERERELAQLAGLLSEYPRAEMPGCRPRHVTDIEVDFATARRRP
jgi:hypothetical protein